MITKADLMKWDSEDRIYLKKEMRRAISIIERVQAETDTPADTLKGLEGDTDYITCIACLVNSNAWDGRIYDYVADWAAHLDIESIAGDPRAFDLLQETLSEDAMQALGLYTKMHLCRLNQLACEAMKYMGLR